MSRRKGYVWALAIFLVLVGGIVSLLVRFHPGEVAVRAGTSRVEVKLLPPCPFHTVTGFYCPGCGSTRAIHYLLVGDFVQSLRAHPLLLPLLPLVAFLLFRFFYEGLTERTIPFFYAKEISFALAILFGLFWLLRNIPISAFDWMRPVGI